MELVDSPDRTRIAFDRSGSGPPLVIVLGAFCDRSTSKPLAALLAPSYTVYEYDRRGRGDSDDGLPCSIESEVEDLAAVIGAAGEPPFVYGHSSGGILALEAAGRGVEMRGLAVYEPPYTGGHHPGPEFGEHLDDLVASGRRSQPAVGSIDDRDARRRATACRQLTVKGQQHIPADAVVAAILGSFLR